MYILCKGWIIVILLCSFIWRANTYKAEQSEFKHTQHILYCLV
ncbi:unnamed protein product [Schistosoma margrebowiei]|uniref:Uncharacterized protein n=1 Tax=Schistosoma margrebowiei TaxID=48269 RepID=A0A183N4W9_9TREM|nr:unnamed protein product [Schistosoma margrebowiei]